MSSDFFLLYELSNFDPSGGGVGRVGGKKASDTGHPPLTADGGWVRFHLFFFSIFAQIFSFLPFLGGSVGLSFEICHPPLVVWKSGCHHHQRFLPQERGEGTETKEGNRIFCGVGARETGVSVSGPRYQK